MSEGSVASAGEDEQDHRGLGGALRALVRVPAKILGALFVPDRAMPEVVKAGHARAAVLVCILAALGSAYVMGTHLDTRRAVMMQMMGGGPGGPGGPGGGGGGGAQAQGGGGGGPMMEMKSDREIAEDIEKMRTMEQVKLGLGAGLATPLKIAWFALVFWFFAWLVGGKPRLGKVFVVAAFAYLPYAVLAGVNAVAAVKLGSIVPDELPPKLLTVAMTPTTGPLVAAFAPLLFVVWSLIIAVFGLAPAAGITRKRAAFAMGLLFYIMVLFAVADVAKANGGRGGMSGGGRPPRGMQ